MKLLQDTGLLRGGDVSAGGEPGACLHAAVAAGHAAARAQGQGGRQEGEGLNESLREKIYSYLNTGAFSFR